MQLIKLFKDKRSKCSNKFTAWTVSIIKATRFDRFSILSEQTKERAGVGELKNIIHDKIWIVSKVAEVGKPEPFSIRRTPLEKEIVERESRDSVELKWN